MRVLIMGMGAIGHTVAATIQNTEIDVLVTKEIEMTTISSTDGKYQNQINQVFTYDTIKEIDYDYLFVTLPMQYKIERMKQIEAIISPQTTIVYMPGNQGILSYMPQSTLKNETILFERVIHVSRIDKYGQTVNIMGTKANMHIAYTSGVNQTEFEALFPQVTNFISNHNLIDILMVSSNPVIHNPRTYRAFTKENLFGEEFYFYSTWTNEDSELFIKLEQEVMAINQAISEQKAIDINYYSMFDHFKVDNDNPDIEKLTSNIANNPALKQIKFYVSTPAELAFNRYVVDDMVLSLRFYRLLAQKFSVSTPLMDEMYQFGVNLIESVDQKFVEQLMYPINVNLI